MNVIFGTTLSPEDIATIATSVSTIETTTTPESTTTLSTTTLTSTSASTSTTTLSPELIPVMGRNDDIPFDISNEIFQLGEESTSSSKPPGQVIYSSTLPPVYSDDDALSSDGSIKKASESEDVMGSSRVTSSSILNDKGTSPFTTPATRTELQEEVDVTVETNTDPSNNAVKTEPIPAGVSASFTISVATENEPSTSTIKISGEDESLAGVFDELATIAISETTTTAMMYPWMLPGENPPVAVPTPSIILEPPVTNIVSYLQKDLAVPSTTIVSPSLSSTTTTTAATSLASAPTIV